MIAENLKRLRERVASLARDSGWPEPPRLVGVTKTRPLADVATLLEAGLTDLAENRWEEWTSKVDGLDPRLSALVNWHFVGALQGRSLRKFYRPLFRIDSLDRLEHARSLSAMAESNGRDQSVLLEVNMTRDAGRSGVLPEDLEGVLEMVARLDRLHVSGMMVMGPVPGYPSAMEETTRVFERSRLLWEKMRALSPGFEVLSMGMSQDYAEGIRAGSTEIRIGRLLFEGVE